MSLTENGNGNGLIMPVSPMNSNGGGFGNSFGGDWGSLIILFLIAAMFGGFGNGFGGNGANNVANTDFPWLLNGQNAINTNTDNGFNNLAITNGINSVNTGIQGLSNQICNSTASVNQTLNSGFANAETSANARQMANMNQNFANQTAMNQGFNNLQSQLANCCCENRLATANLNSTILAENCADRAALSDGIRDILTNQSNNTQRILDQMCQDKIDAKNDTIAQLRSELMYARGQASQDIQTAAIQAGQRQLANEVEQYVLPTPRPAYIVANPNCCTQNNCGCSNF
jgi:hypothetical protein